MKKYELLKNDTIQIGTHTLYRIRACKDFGNVKAGDLGSFIEKEDNLSHEGLCWVSDDACVYDNARVRGNARVRDNAKISKNAFIQSYDDYFTVSNVGSRSDVTTFYKGTDRNIYVTCGCFCGTIDKFIEQVNKKHGDDRHGQVYRKAAEMARLQLNFEEDKINE